MCDTSCQQDSFGLYCFKAHFYAFDKVNFYLKSRYVDNKYQVGRIVFQSLFIQLKLLRISYSDEKTILYGETFVLNKGLYHIQKLLMHKKSMIALLFTMIFDLKDDSD